ncbi:helix-turn-helix domain-containing protein [Dokdonella sp.]|uniref:helix-turn-helix domain-containing protein n=1 Tax=Dokdonella sp. TaxID=2291710 RepID=UPI0032647090
MADRIRLARQRTGLSQAELADQAGVTSSAVAQWESPRGTKPDLNHLLRVAVATNVTLDWLATGSGAKSARKSASQEESPTLVLSVFAQNPVEETVLTCLRTMRPRTRDLLVSLVQELASNKTTKLKSG